MSANEKEIAYSITADHTNFVQGVQAAAGALTGMTTQAQSQFKGLGEAIASIQKPLLAMAAIVGGGSFFKSAIDSTNKLNGEAMKLSKALGVTGTEAASLRTALGDIGSDSDTYVGAFQKFAKQIKSNEDGLRAMGLQTRDSNGNLRDSNVLFTEALGAVGSYKPGLDQTTAAMTLFGKGVDDVMTLQKLNNQVIADAKAKNEELGLTLTKEGVASTKAYKAAMNDVGDVMDAVKNTIGKAVMPIFTEMAQYFAQTGPYVVEVFKGALMGLVGAFRVVQAVVKTVSGVVFEALSTIIDGAGIVGDVFSRLFEGDFSGAYQSAKQLGSRVGESFTNAFRNKAEAISDARSAIEGDFERIYGKGTAMGAPKGGDNTMGDFSKTNEKKGDKSAIPGFESQLEAMRLAISKQGLIEGQYRELSKAEEAKFWRDKAAMANLSVEDRAKAAKKASEAELAVIKQGFEAKVAQLNAESALYRNNMDKKLEIEREIQSKYQEGTKEFEAAQGRINAIQRQAAEQVKQVEEIKLQARRNAHLQGIALEEQQAQFEQQTRQISQAEYLQQLAGFENRRNQIALQALQERLQTEALNPDSNPAEVARLHAEIEGLEQQHQLRMGQILRQQAMANNQAIVGITNGLESGFANVFAGIGTKVRTLGDLFRGLGNSLLQAMTQTFAKMAAEWVAKRLMMSLFSKSLNEGDVTSEAAKAGAGGVASMAAAPFPINLGAPGFGAAMAGMALSFAPMASASGGFDIPGTLNPITQLHAKEMVLPAKHADVIRDMADHRYGDSEVNVSINAHPMPGNYFMVHQDQLVQALKSARRNFAF